MSDSIEGTSDFLLPWPLWIIRNPGVKLIASIEYGVLDGKIALPIFTDEDLAQTALDGAPKPNNLAIESMQPLAFFGLLVLMEMKGLPNVLIDPQPGRPPRFIPTKEFRQHAFGWFEG